MSEASPQPTKVRVLVVIEAHIATTHIIERVLIQCERENFEYEIKLLSNLKESDFYGGALPFFIRCGDPAVRYWVEFLKIIGIPYIYFIDDNFWSIEGGSPLANYYRQPSIRRSLNSIVTKASLIITNTENLANFLKPLNSRVLVLPAPFDFLLLPDVEERARGGANSNQGASIVVNENTEFRVGFAGSPSRIADVEKILLPILNPLLEINPRIIFEFVGVRFPGFDGNPRVRFFPHMDSYKDFLTFKISREWKVGLAPLIDSEANRAKTNNKYREYSACGIAGIYSAVEPYVLCVKDGFNGLLVKNNKDAWIEGVCYLIDNPDILMEMRNSAKMDVYDKYAVEFVAPKWLAVFFQEFANVTSPRSNRSLLVWVKLSLFKLYMWFVLVLTQASITYKDEGLYMVFRRAWGRVWGYWLS